MSHGTSCGCSLDQLGCVGGELEAEDLWIQNPRYAFSSFKVFLGFQVSFFRQAARISTVNRSRDWWWTSISGWPGEVIDYWPVSLHSPGEMYVQSVRDWSRELLRGRISALFVKIKMPRNACSVGKQNIEAGEKEMGSGEKEMGSVEKRLLCRKCEKRWRKKNCIIIISWQHDWL